MINHISRGKDGEQKAKEYLLLRGFDILFTNWKYKNVYEIDVIAEKNETVHFIEVKTRYSLKYGNPEDAVSLKKFRCLQKGAEAFQILYPRVKKIQFDIVSVLILPGKEIEFFFIEDVYLG
ncbi:MAG: YraN family protein [Chitinophagaceae bacterium]|nr:YraN family protein [Chitinophagaceae bacterium]